MWKIFKFSPRLLKFQNLFRNYSKIFPIFARGFPKIFLITPHNFFKIYPKSPFKKWLSFQQQNKVFGGGFTTAPRIQVQKFRYAPMGGLLDMLVPPFTLHAINFQITSPSFQPLLGSPINVISVEFTEIRCDSEVRPGKINRKFVLKCTSLGEHDRKRRYRSSLLEISISLYKTIRFTTL